MKPKYQWLDRRISAPAPFMTLCLSQAEFHDVLSKMGCKERPDWLKTDHADATAHHLSTSDGKAASIVCIKANRDRPGIEVAGLLIHEAVHIWQRYCEWYGETNPGSEQEAYAIQSISQELMTEYARRLDGLI